MKVHAIATLAGCLMVSATGFYIMAAPRRLFMREEDRAAFRPEAVEYDSPQGVRMRRTAPVFAFAPPVILAVEWLAGGLAR